jgi:uncharacterized protein involved in outer membrane biogenesis
MRKVAIVAGVVVVLLVLAIAALPFLLDVNRYQGRIQSELQQRLQRPVSLGKMDLRVFPLAIRVENAVIGEDPQFDAGRPFASAAELFVSAELFPLLRGDVQIKSLELRRPQIELVKNKQGVWNFSTIGEAKRPAPASTPPEPAKDAAANLTLDELVITDGTVAVTNFQTGQARAMYDHIDLEVNDYAPHKAFDLAARVHMPGEGAQMISFDGTVGPFDSQKVFATPVKGKAKFEQVSLAGFQKFLNSEALSGTDGVITGETEVQNDQSGDLASSGNVRIEGARVKGNDIGYPITADYRLKMNMDSEQLTIDRGDLKLGSTPLSVTGSANLRPTPIQLDLKLNANDVSIEEAARLAAAFGVAFNPGMKIAGKLKADVRAQGAATQPAMSGMVNVRGITISGGELKQPVSVPAVDLALSPRKIESNEFAATTGGTTVRAQFTMNDYTTPASTMQVAVRAENAELGEVLSIAKAYGISAAEGLSGSGRVSVNVRASGSTKNPAGMTYDGNGALRDAVLNTQALTQPLKVRTADIRFTQSSMVLQNLAGSLGSSNATGTLTLRNFAAPVIEFALGVDKILVNEWQQMTNAQPAKSAGLWLVPAAHAQAGQPGAFTRVTGSGNINVATIKYDDLLLTNARSKVSLDRGLVRMSPITADLYGGQQTGSIVIDARTTPMTYTVDSRLHNVDTNKLLSSVSNMKQLLYGVLAANADTSFTATSADQIARTLNGKLSLNLQNGKLMNMDVLHQLATVGKFLNLPRPAQNFTNIAQLTGDFLVRNGVATTDNLKAAIDGGTMAAHGAVNLADQTLDLKVIAVLSKAMSQQVGGSGIGGFMNTALSNRNGELVIPVLVTGSFQSPRFAPDLVQIAKMKLQNLVPTLGNPGSLTSVLGGILGEQQQPGDQQQQPGGLGSIIDALGGKKTEQPKPDSPAEPQPQQPQTSPQQPQQKPNDPAKAVTDILNQVLGGQQQKKQPPPPPPPPQEQKPEEPKEQPKDLE